MNDFIDVKFREGSKANQENQTVCHVHNSDNQRIGKGRGENSAKALVNAVQDAKSKGRKLGEGSFGCSSNEEQAHQKALEKNNGNAVGLPGGYQQR